MERILTFESEWTKVHPGKIYLLRTMWEALGAERLIS